MLAKRYQVWPWNSQISCQFIFSCRKKDYRNVSIWVWNLLISNSVYPSIFRHVIQYHRIEFILSNYLFTVLYTRARQKGPKIWKKTRVAFNSIYQNGQQQMKKQQMFAKCWNFSKICWKHVFGWWLSFWEFMTISRFDWTIIWLNISVSVFVCSFFSCSPFLHHFYGWHYVSLYNPKTALNGDRHTNTKSFEKTKWNLSLFCRAVCVFFEINPSGFAQLLTVILHLVYIAE